MECADVRDALARGEEPQGPRLDAHLRRCQACSELLDGGGTLGRELGELRSAAVLPATDVGALFGELERGLDRERRLAGRLRSLPTPVRIGLALLALMLLGGVVLALRRRVDFDVYPMQRLVPALGAYALLIVATLRVALRPLHVAALPLRYRLGIAIAAVILPFFVAAAPAAHSLHPASLGGTAADLVPRALQCFAFGTALALPALCLLWALDRGGHGSWPPALAAAGAAGLTGILALELHCPLTHPAHLVAGHATVGAALVVSYGLVIWFRRRAVARGA